MTWCCCTVVMALTACDCSMSPPSPDGGPGGGTAEKPLGLVHLAAGSRGGQCIGHVGVSMAVVHDHRQRELLGELKVPVKCIALHTWRRVLAIVVEARFADGNDFRSARQIGDGREVRV